MEHYRYPATSVVPDYPHRLRPGGDRRPAAGARSGAGDRGPHVRAGAVVRLVRCPHRAPAAELIELSAIDIALCGPIHRRLPWQQLRRLQLAYYAPRRARRDGWLQLTLRGPRGPAIRVNSTLDGFDAVLRRAAGAAFGNALVLDAATEANLAALGLAPGSARTLRPPPPDRPASGERPANAPP